MESNQPDTNLKLADRGFFSRFFSWLFQLFKGRVKGIDSHSIDNLSPDKPKTQLNSFYKNLEEECKYFGSVSISPEVESAFTQSAKSMLDLGFNDGVYGIEDAREKEIREIAASRSQDIYDLSQTVLNGKLAKNKTELETQKEVTDRDRQFNRQQHQYYDYLVHYYRYAPGLFSRALAWIYGIIALALILADIPLAIKLIQQGFNLHINENFPLQDLLGTNNFWKIIAMNWEVFFTAIGISLCTVYIKIYYDEYINPRFGQKIISRIKFKGLLENITNKDTQESIEREIGIAERHNKNRNRWKTAIFIFTIMTIITLGIFRMHTLELDFGISAVTFIAITLLFPVISGICFSISLTCFQNRIRYESIKRECELSETKFEKSLMQLTELEKQCDDLLSEQEKWEDHEAKVKKYTSILLSYYDQGYKIGLTQPDNDSKDLDFFGKIELWRDKAVSRKINSHLLKA